MTKYKKFETGLEESVSMKFLSKRDIITLLLESLFDEVPASEIFEADDDRLSKATEEDKQGAIDVDSAFMQGTDSNSAENKQESKKDEKEEVKREEATPDFEQLSRSLKVDAIRFL